MDFKGQHILSAEQFDKESLLALFEEARKMEEIVAGQRREEARGFEKIFDGKVLATLFFEPSTRTRFSFEAAFLRLGGKVVSGADMMTTSSVKKRETLYDTGKTLSQLVELIVMRHPEPGSVDELASGCSIPVINAGDGPHQHPTQGLLDLYTIWKNFEGKIDGLKVGMVGDLKHSRVMHSLREFLKHWDVEFVFVAPKGLEMPGEECVEDLGAVIGGMDVIQTTRIQEERFSSKEEAEKHRGKYVFDGEMMAKAKATAILMNPLPRVDEITTDVDYDPRAKYFEQVGNGLAVRMALLAMVLG
ncbi:aspartate carbamoyltransferase [Candidatus Peregrinibacteria bacterium]|jgi:aspartate carbamoyltransferase catalytic subunit|nr:aspartate carbamoyltransferase [Candidatus Peregrinibacteria bacterium]MBT4056374.1 aspartate carbamoyltransferase [Candidatus Peregrinibacteria bacterium]